MFIAIVSAVFAISFAAILYTGDLSVFLDRGIGLTLMGCAVLGVTGAFTLSYRGSIAQAQDVPAILLAGAATTLILRDQLAGEVLFATVVCLVAVTSCLTGVAALLCGRLRLAHMVRFIPYPVLAGFLAATGLLLFLGGIGVAVGESPSMQNWVMLLEPAVALKWGPVVVAAIGIVIATRAFTGYATLPLALLATALGFYLLLAILGLSTQEAHARGLLLGPFQQGGFVDGLGPWVLVQADWWAILAQTPVILTIIAISLIGTTLNASGLELELGEDFDISRELIGTGAGNVISAFVGGIPGYHLLGETILARRLGLVGKLAGLSAAAGCLVILIFGAAILSVLPVGLFASVIAFLGLDLLFTWLWEERRRLRLQDYAIVAMIPVIAVSFSFLTAIAAGLFVASAIFVIAYAKLNVIRMHSSAAVRRSFVERPDSDIARLVTLGDQAQIFELSGYLFFGSANVVRDRIQTSLGATGSDIRWIVVDFRNVSGVDVSTWHVLRRVVADCAQHQVRLILTGLREADQREISRLTLDTSVQTQPTLNHALMQIEDSLLGQTADTAQAGTILDVLSRKFPNVGFESYFDRIEARTGDVIIHKGSTTTEMYLLISGQLDVSVADAGEAAKIVAQIRAGSVVGEMAYYTGKARTADIIAACPSVLLRIDLANIGALELENPAIFAAVHKLVAQHMARRLGSQTALLRDMGI